MFDIYSAVKYKCSVWLQTVINTKNIMLSHSETIADLTLRTQVYVLCPLARTVKTGRQNRPQTKKTTNIDTIRMSILVSFLMMYILLYFMHIIHR